MPYEYEYDCSSIVARITPEVQLPRMLYECSQNACGMAAEYGSSVQEFKQNAAGIPRMYFECTWNVTRMSQVYQEYGRNISQ